MWRDRTEADETALQIAKLKWWYRGRSSSRRAATTMLKNEEHVKARSPPYFEPWGLVKVQLGHTEIDETAPQSAKHESLTGRRRSSRRATSTILKYEEQARACSPPSFEPWSLVKVQMDRSELDETALQSARHKSFNSKQRNSRRAASTTLKYEEQARARSPPNFEPWSSFQMQRDRTETDKTALQIAKHELWYRGRSSSRRAASAMLKYGKQARASFSAEF